MTDAARADASLIDRLIAEADPTGLFDDIPPAPRDRPLPLSFAQRRLWFLDRMGVAGNGYTIPLNMRLEGPLDVAALERALAAVIERHEALRTVFRDVDGVPVQEVLPAAPMRLTLTDLSHLPKDEGEAQVSARVDAANRAAFVLSTGPLVHAALLRMGPEDHVLLLAVHHIAFDGWSVGIFLAELGAQYRGFRRGKPLRLPPLDVQYPDFAAWQATAYDGARADAEIAFWRRTLEGVKPLDLPGDHARPALLGFRGGRVDFHLPAGAWGRFEAEARRQGATPYMALLAAFAMLVARITGETRVTVGTPVAGRNRADIEPLIGFFVNSVVMATDLSGNPTVGEAIARVRGTALDAFDHADMPFERLVEALQPERSLDRSPLFQVMVALHQNEAMAPDIDLDGLAVTPIPFVEMTARFDLEIHSWIEAGSPKGICTYNRDLYEGPTVERLIGRLARLIESAAADPGRRLDSLDYMPASELADLAAWNDTAHPWSGEPLHVGFERVARDAPDRAALVFGERSVTLGELDARANTIAQKLVAAGVRRGDVVSLCLDRGDRLIAAFLAVFKAGACYLPVDPAEPAERLAHILADSRAVLHLTEPRHEALFADAPARADGSAAPVVVLDAADDAVPAVDPGPPGVATSADDLAYIIYTSGSTGRPKGIEGRHGTIANLVEWHIRHHPGPPLRTLQYAQVSFDIFFQELFSSWFTGAACYVVDERTRQDMHALAAFIRRHRLERIFLPFAPVQYLIDVLAGDELPDLVQVFTAGEQLQATPLVVDWFARRPHVSFHNHYGPTECYVVTAHDLPADPSTWPALPPVGRPVDNVRIHIVDADFRPLPVGVPGEILIGGVQISRGYRGRPDLTAEKFVPDPFAPEPGRRAYRTGDLGVRRADGAIQFLGRMDRQLKIRGYRVEPGEIEVALMRSGALAQALVATYAAGPNDVRLVAYVVPRPDLPASERAGLARSLKAGLDGHLPDHMIPAVFMVLDALPLTVAGKISRLALPDPGAAVTAEAEPAARAASPIEAAVSEIFADLLGRDRVGLDEDFFDLGGHSLLGSRLVSRLRGTLGVELPLSRLFETPTAAGLAHHVEMLRAGGVGSAEPIAATGALAAPASFAQRRLWLMDRMGTTGAAYLMPVNLALRGAVDAAALRRALSRIVDRHAALRTVFREVDGEPEQVVLPPADLPFPIDDLSGLGSGERAAAFDRLVAEMGTRPFDLAVDPPFRARLVRLGAEDFRLLATFHHIASDGWSIALFFAELGQLYSAFRAGRPDPLPPVALSYADFAAWQRRTIAGERRERLIAYWKPLLEDLAPLSLPTDRPRRAGERFAGAGFRFALAPDLTAGIRDLARKNGATLYTTLLAAYFALMHRLSSEERLAVGSPIANRNRGETEGLIGFFVNALVLTAEVDPAEPWSDLLRRVRERVLGAFDHQDMPFEALVEALRPARDVSRNPLFQILFALQQPEAMAARPQLEGLEIEALELGAVTARFDLETHMWLDGQTLQGLVTYDADLFDRATVETFLERFRHLLAAVVADPARPVGRLALASPEERAALAAAASTAALPVYPAGTIHEKVTAALASVPGRIVVTDGTGACTAGELLAEAGLIADRLAARGLEAGEPVLVLAGRDRRAVAALLGILMAGGAYVPLDPRHPPERIAFVAEDTGARFALAQADAASRLPQGLDILAMEAGEIAPPRAPCAVAEGSTAYVIYTSGSTGRPKGVAVSHANATRLFTATDAAFGFGPDDVWTCTHSLAFDFSVWEIWAALLTGGRVVMVDGDTLRSPEALADLILAEGVTVLSQTPSAFQALAPVLVGRPGLESLPLRTVVFGGEALHVPSLAPWFDRFGDASPRLVNCYGITETTVHVTVRPLSRADCEAGPASPIGAAIPDLSLRLLDAGLEPVPDDVVGEICVAGAGVARGYLNRPDVDAERFVPDPFGGPGRMYRSGDLARRRRGGEIEYLGRLDAQVKLRGHRIEPGEIAAALRADPRVADAAVLLRKAPGGDPRLVAWLVPARSDGAAEAGEAEQVERWTRVFQDRYGEADPVSDDPRLKLTGWTSAYDRKPIPLAVMRRWADDTAAAIRAFRPRRILEIGCGTGILLFRLAPGAERYLGIDPAASALDHVRAAIATVAPDCAHAELRQMAADGLDALGAETFDTVVINSVAQYLPGAGYLIRTLEQAAARLAPGGRIFVGDLRDARLVEAFHADVAVARADPATSVAVVAAEQRRALAQETELLVAPDFFRALVGRLPGVTAVGFLGQPGPAGELNSFRYAAVLEAAPAEAGQVDGLASIQAVGFDLGAIERLLGTSPHGVVLRGLANARPARALARAAALASGRPATAGEMAALEAGGGVDPEALAALADRLGLAFAFAPDPQDPARFDAVLTRGAAPVHLPATPIAGDPARHATDPLGLGRLAEALADIRQGLGARLPDYMLPAHLVPVPALPLTVNGKLDARALPDPWSTSGGAEDRPVRAPATATEAALLDLFRQLLGLERIGTDDDFFALGGHSLIATSLCSRVRNRFGVELPLLKVFQTPTVAALAESIDTLAWAGAGQGGPGVGGGDVEEGEI